MGKAMIFDKPDGIPMHKRLPRFASFQTKPKRLKTDMLSGWFHGVLLKTFFDFLRNGTKKIFWQSAQLSGCFFKAPVTKDSQIVPIHEQNASY